MFQILLVVSFCTSLGVNIATLARLNKVQRREITFPETFTTKAHCALQHASLDKRLDHLEECLTVVSGKIEEWRQSMERAGEERLSKLHDRVDDILRAVSRLEGKVK